LPGRDGDQHARRRARAPRQPAGGHALRRRRPQGPVLVSTATVASDPRGGRTAASPGRRAWKRFRRHRLAVAGAAVLALLAAAAVLAPTLAPYDPYDLAVGPNGELTFAAPPSASFPLGTDSVGRDVMSRLIYAGRVSLTIGIVAAL